MAQRGQGAWLAAVLVATLAPIAARGAPCSVTLGVGSSGALDEKREADCEAPLRTALASASPADGSEALDQCAGSRMTLEADAEIDLGEHGSASAVHFCAAKFLIVVPPEGSGSGSGLSAFSIGPGPRDQLAQALGKTWREAQSSSESSTPMVRGGTSGGDGTPAQGGTGAPAGVGESKEPVNGQQEGATVASNKDGSTGGSQKLTPAKRGQEENAMTPDLKAAKQEEGAVKTALVEEGARAVGRPAFPGAGPADPDFGGSGPKQTNANCYAYAGVSPYQGSKSRFCHPGVMGGRPMATPGPSHWMTCPRIMAGVAADRMQDSSSGEGDFHEVAVFHHLFERVVPVDKADATHFVRKTTDGSPDEVVRLSTDGSDSPADVEFVQMLPGFHDYHFHRRNKDMPEETKCWSDKNGKLPPRGCFQDPDTKDNQDLTNHASKLHDRVRFVRSLPEKRAVPWLGGSSPCGTVWAKSDHFDDQECAP